jgi:hypothetical protein
LDLGGRGRGGMGWVLAQDINQWRKNAEIILKSVSLFINKDLVCTIRQY